MKKLTNPLLIALLITGFAFSGCSKVDSPTGQDINPASVPQLNSPGDDKEENRMNLTPADLIGTWTLTEIFPNKAEQEVCDLTYSFEEGGSGQISKEGEELNIHWSLNEKILEFTWEEKSWEVAAYLVEDDLYTVEWCEKAGKRGDKNGERGEKDGKWGDKNGKKCKKNIRKMKFIRNQ